MNNYEPIRAWVRQRVLEHERIVNTTNQSVERLNQCGGAVKELNMLLDVIHGLETQERFVAEALHIE